MITGGLGTTFGLVTRGLGGVLDAIVSTGRAWIMTRRRRRSEPEEPPAFMREDEEMIRGWDA